MARALVLCSLLAWSCVVASEAEDTKLYLLTILPYPVSGPLEQPSWPEGMNVLPAAYLAVDMINQRDDLLPGYSLELINEDGGCDVADRARISFVRRVIAERGQRPVVGIIGPGCSTSTLAVSAHSSHPDIAIVNLHLAGTPLLESRTDFAYSFGLLGSSYSLVRAIAELMLVSNWTRIAVLYDEERVFFLSTYQELEKDLVKLVPNADLAFTSAVYDTYFPLSDIVSLNIRIIVVLTGPDFARKIMCLAAHDQVAYPRYQWVWMGRNISEFNETVSFHYESRQYTCPNELLQSILFHSVFVNYVLDRRDGQMTKSHITYSDFQDMYNERLALYSSNKTMFLTPESPQTVLETNEYATVVFDAVWAIALALSKVAPFFNLTVYGRELGQVEQSNMIRDILNSTEFEGVSGHINFNSSNGYTERRLEVGQGLANNTYVLVGYVEGVKLNIVTAPVLVPDEFKSQGLQLVSGAVASFFSVITVLLVSITIAVHVYTTKHSEHPSVKAQSPKLNQISYCGFYLFSLGTILFTVHKAVRMSPESYGAICQAIWPWFFSISFTVFFAPICARTWRLYRIFIYYLNPGPLISDVVLLGFVGVCIFIDVVLATAWTAADPFQGEEYIAYTNRDGDYYSRLSCVSQYTTAWFSAIYFLKVILLLTTVTLSLLTRNISNEKFKTSYLRIFVYLFALVWINGILLYYFLSYQGLDIHADYVVLLMMCNTLLFLALLIVFLPPVYPLLKERLLPSLWTATFTIISSKWGTQSEQRSPKL